MGWGGRGTQQDGITDAWEAFSVQSDFVEQGT